MADAVVLEFDFGDTVRQLQELRKATFELKKEKEELKKAIEGDEEALKKYGGNIEEVNKKMIQNESQTRVLGKEQRTLTNIIDQGTKAQNAAKGSIEANRAELSRLTAEYIKLANPTKEQTQRLKTLSDTLKEQEKAYGDTRRNVGNYQEAIEAAANNLNIFGVNVGQTIGNLKQKQKELILVKNSLIAFSGGTTGASNALKIFRLALISTGIGVIVVALGALVSAFLSTQKGVDTVNKVLTPLGIVLARITGIVQELATGAFAKLTAAIDNPKQALTDLGNIIQENVINRIKSFAVAGEGLSKILAGDFKGGLKDLGNAFIQFNTGVENGIEKISKFGETVSNEISNAIDDGKRIAELTIQIEELEISLTKTREEQLAQFEEYRQAAADQTKTDKERLEALKQAEAIRNKVAQDDIKLIDLQIEKKRLQLKQNDTDREAQKELAELEASRTKAEREALSQTKEIISQRSGLAKKAIAEERKALDDLRKKKEEDAKEEKRKLSEKLESDLEANKDFFDQLEVQEKAKLADGILTREEYEQKILELKQERLLGEIDVLNEFGEEVAEKEIELQNLVLDNEIENKEREVEAEEERNERLIELKEELAEAEEELQSTKIDAAQSAFDIIGDLAKGEGALAKVAFLGKQAASIAEIIASSQSAQAQITAYAAAVPPILPPGIPNPAFPVAQANAAIQTTRNNLQAGISIAAIAAQTVGQFLEEGGEVFNVGGKSHDEGGTKYMGEDGNRFEVERGEKLFVLKKDASRYIDRYGALNEMFGGAPWSTQTRFAAQGGNIPTSFDGGFAARNSAQDVDQKIAMEQLFKNLPSPVLQISELEKVQRDRDRSVSVSEL